MLSSRSLSVLRMLLSSTFIVAVLVFAPGDAALWKRIIACILAVAFGFQVANGLAAVKLASGQGEGSRLLIESLLFVFLILGVLSLPQTGAYVLLAAGYLWRYLLKLVWH